MPMEICMPKIRFDTLYNLNFMTYFDFLHTCSADVLPKSAFSFIGLAVEWRQ